MSKELLKKANHFFTNKDYQSALHFYSNILKNHPDNKDAQIGLMLSDMAINENEDQAHTLFDYYIIIKDKDANIAYDIINNLMYNQEEETEIIVTDKMEAINGISYDDFELIMKEHNNDFEKVFYNIIFSTKIIISTKQEFLSFITILLKYNFNHIVFSYLESFIITFGIQESVIDIAKSLAQIDH